MSEPFLGQIQLFSFNFPPKGWGMCNGQLLPINQNQALFSLLGTTFGGDGRVTFALPDLRGRVPISVGARPGGSTVLLGESDGTETVALSDSQLPKHAHTLDVAALTAVARCKDGGATLPMPAGNTHAIVSPAVTQAYSDAAPDADMRDSSVAFGGTIDTIATGSSQAHLNQQPYLVVTYCIALQGIFPSQN